MVLAVAAAELRSLRRLARTWVAAALAMATGTALFMVRSSGHHASSGHSSTRGSIDPAFLAHGIGLFVLWVLVAGVVFLAFDMLDRDRRDRVGEVLAARPISNLEFFAGRIAGLAFATWLPVLLMAAAAQITGVFAERLDWPAGGTMEPWSLASFLVVDAVPALLLAGSATAFLAVALRNRLATAVAALALLGLHVWVLFQAPLYLLPAVAGVAGFAQIASDLLPRFADGADLVQRGCLLLLAAAFLCGAAALHSRRDAASRRGKLAAGAALAVAGSAGIAALAVEAMRDTAERDAWRAAHAAKRNDPAADLERVVGSVSIDPGVGLKLDVGLRLRLPEPRGQREIVLSFNPGLRVQDARVDGESARFEHALGLLTVALPARAAPGSGIELALRAEGVPDPRFAYLDSAVDAGRRSIADSQLHLLGTEASIFAADYVALMPGARWLPAPGASFESDDASRPRSDFFEVDLTVDVPQGWLVAGPGRRRIPGDDPAKARFRFQPGSPVPEVGLVASRFERRGTRIADVEVELLMHEGHLANIDAFGPDAAIGGLLALFEYAAESGLAYPYGVLSVVETPGALRGYGGGWRMDTVQALPGVMLLREHGFPTARLARRIRDVAADGYQLTNLLSSWFARDAFGGDVLHALRNFVRFQTVAGGEGAVALDFAVEELVERTVGFPAFRVYAAEGFFSAHLLALDPAAFGPAGVATAGDLLDRALADTGWLAVAAARETTRPAVWSLADAASLADLVPQREPRESLNALTLKSRALAESIVDTVGEERVLRLLRDLRRRHAAGYFTAADFVALATAADASLGPLVDDLLRGTSLPGFVASEVEVERLADDERGRPRYQVRLHARNEEPTSGALQVYCDTGHYDTDYPGMTGPLRVAGRSAVEVGLVTSAPPRLVAVTPYLSLNRQTLYLRIADFDATKESPAEPFVGSRPSSWRPPDEGLVVDDLDDGFRATETPRRDGLAALASLRRGRAAVERDMGLPVYPEAGYAPRGVWYRRETRWSWGRYRRTVARTLPGTGEAYAEFAADLPTGGRWRLDYHLPAPDWPSGHRLAREESFGRYDIRLVAGGEETSIDFDAAAADWGWNRLGDFDLPAGEARVVVSDRTDGDVVVADAIRWRPALSPEASR